MGRLIDGNWYSDEDYPSLSTDGRFERKPTLFHANIDNASPGRFHLWIAHNCSWSQRLLITRNLLGLSDHISVSVAHYRRDDEGWWFRTGIDDLQLGDDERLHLWRVYVAADANYTGRATVPVLWDRQQKTIVNNESSECLRMLGKFANNAVELYPAHLAEQIDELNDWIYSSINNGVYNAGFARTQKAYDEAYDELFAAMDRVEDILGVQRYLAGSVITEADVRLFPTLARFDSVYYSHFKCNKKQLMDYPNLWAYTRDLYQTPGIGETVFPDIYKLGYYGNSMRLNPSRIIPQGPEIDWMAPHKRGEKPAFSYKTTKSL